jgi:hypothetical protein
MVVRFSVPFVHRLRFTSDIMGVDRHVLCELLEPSGSGTARVQFWVDASVAEAHPTLLDKVQCFASEFAHRVTLKGPPHIVAGGEELKNDIHVLERMLREFHFAVLDRRTYVVVMGGARSSTPSGSRPPWPIVVCGWFGCRQPRFLRRIPEWVSRVASTCSAQRSGWGPLPRRGLRSTTRTGWRR